jgi:hypothetical protein
MRRSEEVTAVITRSRWIVDREQREVSKVVSAKKVAN